MTEVKERAALPFLLKHNFFFASGDMELGRIAQ
jgi:hypothetical protein